MKTKRIIIPILLMLLLIFGAGCSELDAIIEEVDGQTESSDTTAGDTGDDTESVIDTLPKNVQESYYDYDGNNWEGKTEKTKGTKDYSTFQNRDGDLPEKDSSGNKIEYKEHDVNNKKEGHGRDAERFISGSDGSVYYTGDHYETFTKIK